MLNIREIRLRAGMTQEQLAVYLGVSRATLSLAELHQRRLPNRAVPALQRLCDLHTQHTTNSGADTPEALIAAIAALDSCARATTDRRCCCACNSSA